MICAISDDRLDKMEIYKAKSYILHSNLRPTLDSTVDSGESSGVVINNCRGWLNFNTSMEQNFCACHLEMSTNENIFSNNRAKVLFESRAFLNSPLSVRPSVHSCTILQELLTS